MVTARSAFSDSAQASIYWDRVRNALRSVTTGEPQCYRGRGTAAARWQLPQATLLLQRRSPQEEFTDTKGGPGPFEVTLFVMLDTTLQFYFREDALPACEAIGF